MAGTEAKKVRWGLLGVGEILHRWMKGARQVPEMEIVAIASRTRDRAELMAKQFDIPEVLTYKELFSREDIEIVYIPVPHTAHKELAIRAMKAGKSVLVEKPAAINAAEFAGMRACAKECGVFLMEAVWTAFFPAMRRILDLIASGEIGTVRAADFWMSACTTCILPK